MASGFRRTVEAFIDANLAPAVRSKLLAEFARTERDKLIAKGEASKQFITSVDGHQGADEGSVRGDGQGIINYRFQYIAEAARFAMTYLQQRTPSNLRSRGTGLKLQDSYWMSVDGKYIPPGITINYEHIPPMAEIVIGNTAEFWRRAELNLKGLKVLNYPAPHEIDGCISALNRQFGRSMIKAERKYDFQFPSKYQPVQSPLRKAYTYNSPVLILNVVR